MTVPFARPFNQKIRITGLRLCAIVVLPVVVLAAPVWDGLPLAALHMAGILCVVAAVLGRFWSILHICGRKNSAVMQDGPYSLCRHPLYLFSTIGAMGFGLMLGSLTVTALIGGTVFAILSMTAAREEAFLRHTFGARYDNYAAKVPRMIPLGRFHTPASVTFDTGTLARNMADALVFLGLIPLAGMIGWLHLADVLPTIAML